MEIGIIEGAITLISIIKHILTSSKKLPIYFMKFAQFEEWMFWYILKRFQIREQSSFLNVLYHSALETKVGCN